MKKIILSILGFSLLYGCAASDGVVRTAKGTFVVARSSSGISDVSGLKAASIEAASVFCERSGRAVQVVRLRGSEPPYYLANLPKVEIEFMCSDRQGANSIVSTK